MTDLAGLHHVQVAAPPGCESAARAFYGGVLGLREIEKPPLLADRGGCWFEAGPGEVHIGVEDPFRPATKAHPAFEIGSTAALGALAVSLAEAGIDVRWAADAEIPGQSRFHVSDPWGNRLEFIAAVSA